MNFTIERTRTTPYVVFDKGHMQIEGKSVPLLNLEFYTSIYKQLAKYTSKPYEVTKVDVHLSAANAYSKRSILKTFQLLEQLAKKGKQIIVNWYYDKEDDEMRELGMLYKSLLQLPFHIYKK
jgi:replicative DNA helicase